MTLRPSFRWRISIWMAPETTECWFELSFFYLNATFSNIHEYHENANTNLYMMAHLVGLNFHKTEHDMNLRYLKPQQSHLVHALVINWSLILDALMKCQLLSENLCALARTEPAVWPLTSQCKLKIKTETKQQNENCIVAKFNLKCGNILYIKI